MSLRNEFNVVVKHVFSLYVLVFCGIGIVGGLLAIYLINPILFNNQETIATVATIVEDEDRIENGIHVRTGLKDAEGLMTVVNNCTNCHSAKLVTQNRMSSERWDATIRWMQETQNLWDLGGNQEIIVNYLVTQYPQENFGRRKALTNIEWYALDD